MRTGWVGIGLRRWPGRGLPSTLLVLIVWTGEARPESAKTCGHGTAQLSVQLPPGLYRSNLPDAICDWLGEGPWRLAFSVSRPDAEERNAQQTGKALLVRHTQDSTLVELTRDRAVIAQRRLPLLSQPGVVGIERLAQAVHSMLGVAEDASLLAAPRLKSGAPHEPERTPVAPTLPDRPAPSAVESEATQPTNVHAGHQVGAGYRAYLRGDEPLYHGPELQLHLASFHSPIVDAAAIVRAGYVSPAATSVESVSLRIDGASFSAELALMRALGAWTLRGSVGYSLEPTRTRVRALREDPTFRQLTDGTTELRHFVGLAGGASLRIGAVELCVQGLLRWQAIPSPYRIREDDVDTVVAEPWRWQPGLQALLGYSWGQR